MTEATRALFVSPDGRVLNFFRMFAQPLGYEVLTASQAREGLIYAWRDRPQVIIFDTNLPDMDGLTFARKLHSDPRTSEAFLLPLADQADFQQEMAYIAAGCVGYLVKSPQLVQTLQQFLDNPARARKDLFSRAEGKLVCFLSAKGGVGTTSLLTNLADHTGRARPRRKTPSVCVADLVLPIGSVAQVVGYKGDFHLVALSEQPVERLTTFYIKEQLIRPERWHFSFLPGAPDPEQASRLQVGKIKTISDALRGGYDYVFLDLGRTLSRISLPLLLGSDLIVLVAGHDVSTVTNTMLVIDYLQSKGLARERIFILLNRAVGLEGMTKSEIESALQHPIAATIPYLREQMTLANNQHLPYLEKYQNSTTNLLLRDIAIAIESKIQELREAQKNA
jgi:Flp pilus assembly CpaE family ATPase